jgi:hypothetical protein
VNAYGDSWGTPFDLEDLESHPDVISGDVDLDEIRYVRITDIPGTGDFLDSQSNPIYDAWLTWGSGGVDLEAVGILNGESDILFDVGRPNVVANEGGGNPAWSNVSNVTDDDDQFATVSLAVNDESQYLLASDFNFSIPSTATITGITVRVDTNSDEEYVSDFSVVLLKDGVATGDDFYSDETWGTNKAYGGPYDEIITHGAPDELWGTTWTPADINDPDFGVAIAAVNLGAGLDTAKIDFIEIAVFYED